MRGDTIILVIFDGTHFFMILTAALYGYHA